MLLPLGIGVLYSCVIMGGSWLGLAYAVAGLACGVVGAVPSLMVGLFPARIRVSGISFTYNMLRAWASITPLLLIGCAMEPVDLRNLLRGDGHSGCAEGGVFWLADAAYGPCQVAELLTRRARTIFD